MSLKETTVLIVSHDTQFLENVCSDGEAILLVTLAFLYCAYPSLKTIFYNPCADHKQSSTTNNVLNGVPIGNWFITPAKCLLS